MFKMLSQPSVQISLRLRKYGLRKSEDNWCESGDEMVACTVQRRGRIEKRRTGITDINKKIVQLYKSRELVGFLER